MMVSTHAPARGATCVLSKGDTKVTVSTHAPARGATGILPYLRKRGNSFNPRTRTGCDGEKRGTQSNI